MPPAFLKSFDRVLTLDRRHLVNERKKFVEVVVDDEALFGERKAGIIS